MTPYIFLSSRLHGTIDSETSLGVLFRFGSRSCQSTLSWLPLSTMLSFVCECLLSTQFLCLTNVNLLHVNALLSCPITSHPHHPHPHPPTTARTSSTIAITFSTAALSNFNSVFSGTFNTHFHTALFIKFHFSSSSSHSHYHWVSPGAPSTRLRVPMQKLSVSSLFDVQTKPMVVGAFIHG